MVNLNLAKKINFKFFYSYVSFTLGYYDAMYFNFFGRNLYNYVLGPDHKIGLPKRKTELRVIRSPHVNKKSMEYFKLEISKDLYSFFDTKLFNVFNMVLTHVFYFFKFFDFKSKVNSTMILRVWSFKKINHKFIAVNAEYAQEDEKDNKVSISAFSLGLPFLEFIENSSFSTFFMWIVISIMVIYLGRCVYVKFVDINFTSRMKPLFLLGLPGIFKKKKKQPEGVNYVKPVDGENVNFHNTINPKTGIKESDAEWTLRMYGNIPKHEIEMDLPEGEYQEVLKSEAVVKKLYAQLSDEEKVEFDSYLHREYFYRDFSNYSWSQFYNTETGAVWNPGIYDHPVYIVRNLILSWQENTLKFFFENEKFPWADEVANAIVETRHAKLNAYLPEYTPPLKWFKQILFEFQHPPKGETPQSMVSYYFKEVYEKSTYLSIEYNKDNGIGQNSLELLGTLWYNYRVFMDKAAYKLFLAPKDLGITVADFREWARKEGLDEHLVADHRLQMYIDGGNFKHKLHDLRNFEKHWFHKWNPTKFHLYNKRILPEKEYWYLWATDNSNGKEVMLVFKGQTWVDVVSLPKYLGRVRREQRLIRERELVLQNISQFYERYTFKEYFQRQVQWLEEFSEVLSNLGLHKELEITSDYYSSYATGDVWSKNLMWNPILDGGRLEAYYFDVLESLHYVYHNEVWAPMVKVYAYFWFIFIIDHILMSFSLRRFRLIHQYKLLRSKAKEIVLYKTGQALTYSHDPVYAITIGSFFYYIYYGYYTPLLYYRWVFTPWSEAPELKNFGGAQVYDVERNRISGHTIGPFSGSYGWLTNIRVRWNVVKGELAHEVDVFNGLWDLFKQKFWTSLETKNFSKELIKFVVVETHYLEQIVFIIVTFPVRFTNFLWVSANKLYDFMFLIPSLIKEIPGVFTIVNLTIQDLSKNFVLLIKTFIHDTFSAFLKLWLFNANVIERWFELLVVEPYRYFYNHVIYYLVDYVIMFMWNRERDRYYRVYDYHYHKRAFKYLRNPDRYRPHEHWAQTDGFDIILWFKTRLFPLHQFDSKYYFWLNWEQFIWKVKTRYDYFIYHYNYGFKKYFNLSPDASEEELKACFWYHYNYYIENMLFYKLHYHVSWGLREARLNYWYIKSRLAIYDYWIFNITESILFYPVIYAWRVFVYQPFISLKYLYFLFLDSEGQVFYNWYKGLTKKRIQLTIDEVKADIANWFKDLFISIYKLICDINYAIFYPFIAWKHYILETTPKISLYFKNGFSNILFYFDLNGVGAHLIKLSHPYLNLIGIDTLPNPNYSLEEPTLLFDYNEVTGLTPTTERIFLQRYYDLGLVNLNEYKYPLSSSQKLLDNVGLFDRRKRNLIILENHGYSFDVELMRKVGKRYATESREVFPEKIVVDSQIKVFLEDLYLHMPRLQIYYTTVDWLFHLEQKYDIFKKVLFIRDSDFWSTTVPFLTSIRRKSPDWRSNIVEFVQTSWVYCYNLMVKVYDYIAIFPLFVKSFLKYIEYWYYINWDNFSMQLFIDIFYYWYYDVPEDYQRTKYGSTWRDIRNDNWFLAHKLRYQWLSEIHNANDRKFFKATRTWGYYHQQYWETKEYFKGTRLEFLSTLLKSIWGDLRTLRQNYIENKFFLNHGQFHKKFPNRTYLPTWFQKYDDDIENPIPFKGQELIDYYLLRTKYSIYFFINFSIESLDFMVSYWSFELWKVLRGLVTLPSKLFQVSEVISLTNITLKSNLRYMLQQFNILFGNKYILPIINKSISYYEIATLYLFNTFKVIVLWYSKPIEVKYSIKFIGYTNFTEIYFELREVIVEKETYIKLFELLKRNYSEILPVLSIILTKTKEALSLFYDLIMFYTNKELLLLKAKIKPCFSNYLQEFHSRVGSIREVLLEGYEKYLVIVRSYNIFLEEKEINKLVDLVQSIVLFIVDVMRCIFDIISLFLFWTLKDVYDIVKSLLLYDIPNLGYSLFEGFMTYKYYYVHFIEACLYYGYYIKEFIYDLCKTIYNMSCELITIIISYCANVISWILSEVFVIDFYINIFNFYAYGTWSLVTYISELFVYAYNTLINFNLRFFFLRINMCFTDFWQYITIGEYWWDNIILSTIFVKVWPLIEWIEYNFRVVGIEELVIRGDVKRRLPYLYGESDNNISSMEKSYLEESFDYLGKGKDMWNPMQVQDLWRTHGYILKYINMLDSSGLPTAIKLMCYRSYIRSIYWETIFALKNYDTNLTFRVIDDYFIHLLKQEVFGKKLINFDEWKKMGQHTALFEEIKAVERFHKVRDPLFVEWWTRAREGSWLPPTMFNDLDWTDFYFLDDTADELWEDPWECVVWMNHLDMWKHGMEDTVLEYHLQLKDALTVYDFMAFNQKIYNFYLDMFGPAFAYLYYHFPGHSLQLNDDRFSYIEKIKWLNDFVYETKSTMMLNMSMVNRLNDFDFRLYMKGAENWARYNMYMKYFWIPTNEDIFVDTTFYGKKYARRNYFGEQVVNLQEFVTFYFDMAHCDEELDYDFIEAKWGILDESVLGPDDSFYSWWDEVDKQFGWKIGWKIPYEWFYELPYFDFKNNFLFQKDVYWFNAEPLNKMPYKGFMYHRNFLGYGDDWEIGGLSIRDRLMQLHYWEIYEDMTWHECFNNTLLVSKDALYVYSDFGENFTPIREFFKVIIDTPNIDVKEYNRTIRERMHNKPACYDYWVFYEKSDTVTSSLNNFENLNVLNNNVFYDAPSEWQYGFQDPASPIMEGIIDLHHDLCFFLILVSVFVSWILFNIIYYFNTTNFNVKLRVKKWVQEEIREILIDMVYIWHGLTIRLVNYANENKGNSFVNSIAKTVYDITAWFVYLENVYLDKWFHDKEIENLVINSSISNESVLPKKFVDILKYISVNGYDNVEYFYNESENKGYFVSKDNEALYNEFKNNPNVVSHTVQLNTILNNLIAVRGLQLDLSSKYLDKAYLNNIIADNELYYEDFEEDFEETELKEEIVWFPQLFTHNTTIEVVWTIIPAIILVCIAIPSFSLLYAMDQIWQPLFTIKVLGNQWYWSYEYC